MGGREDSKVDETSDDVPEEANQTELKEAPLIITTYKSIGEIYISGPLADELLGLVKDVRKSLKSWVLLYGPRGTEIKR